MCAGEVGQLLCGVSFKHVLQLTLALMFERANALFDLLCHDVTRVVMVRHGAAWHGTAWHGMERYMV
jgi:hypothetical protein